MVLDAVCDCGKTVTVLTESLTNGHTKSCGCLVTDSLKSRPYEDLVGKDFGRLHVVALATGDWVGRRYECVCICGNKVTVRGSTLVNNATRSCGCLRIDVVKDRSITHGLSNTKEYNSVTCKKRRELKILHDSAWTTEMEISIKKFQTSCVICGMTDVEHKDRFGQDLHIDHVLPLSKGNGLLPGNAVILCSICNSKKFTKSINDLPLDWQASLIWNAIQFKNHWEELQERGT